MKKTIFLILFTLLFFNAFSSQNEKVIKKYDNILLVYYKTAGHDEKFEDSIKLDFIAKRVLDISKTYNYSGKIVLNYLFQRNSEKYFISYSKPIYYSKYSFEDTRKELYLINNKRKSLVFSVFDNHTNQTNILKLVDYTLQNIDSVKKSSLDLYELGNSSYLSIDTNLINKVLKKNLSDNAIQVFNKKLYREYDNKKYTYFISYYTQNDKYFPYYRNRKQEIILDTLNSVVFYANDLNNVFIFHEEKKFNCYLKSSLRDSLIIYRNIEIFKDKYVGYNNVFIEELMDGIFILKFHFLYWYEECAIFSAKYGLVEESLGKYKFNYFDDNLIELK